jgi:DNA-binding NtrC family response regulator
VPRVIARGPDQTECIVDLEPPRAVLLGRAPDPQTAPQASDGVETHFKSVTLAAPSISANHALVWVDADVVCVRDLGSKNGTWLLLPSDRTVRVADADVVLHLAHVVDDGTAGDDPANASWTGRRDFATAVGESIEAWLRRQGVEAQISVVPRVRDGSEPPMRIPLSTGEGLDIVPLATAHASWSRLLERLWRWVARQNSLFDAEEEARGEGLILASRAIRIAHRDVVDASQAGARTLLLTGPSGAGKEVLAEVFHRHSGRSGPFVAVNCSMFSKELLRAELFGAAAGSFTDGKQRIVGAVERAQGGTLFLDEVGEMGIDVQPMLLRFLDQGREFQSVGQYGRTQRADIRVIAATNRDLREAVRSGNFRADLWYRMSVHVVDVPALRARWDDVVAFLESIPLESGRTLRDTISAEALDLLRMHPWDGNFRELGNFTQRVLSAAHQGLVDANTCRRALERGALRPASAPPVQVESTDADWTALAARAMQAYVEDRGGAPRSWDDQKEWNEKYLKPLVFFHMSGAANQAVPLDEGALSSLATQLAPRMQADRGTAAKQLARYFERFRGLV